MLFTDYAKGFIELGFPVAVAVYLLIYQQRTLDRVRNALAEVQLGLRLILHELNVMDEYNKAIAEYKAKKEKEND